VCAIAGLLWPALTHAGLTVSAADAGCPTRAQVVAALEASLPGVTSSPGSRLELTPMATGLSLRLVDPTGSAVLERTLALKATRPEACQALAEATALVVARYFRDLAVHHPSAAVERVIEVPPAPSPPQKRNQNRKQKRTGTGTVMIRAPEPPARSSAFLGVSASARVGAGTGSSSPRGDLLLSLALHRGHLAAELSGGISSTTAVSIPDSDAGELRLRAFPFRAALGLPLPVPGGALVPTLGAALDLLSFQATGLVDARGGLRLEPAAEVGVSYLLTGRRLYLRLRGGAGRRLFPRDFEAGLPQPVFRTADAYFRADVEVGLVLRKNGSPAGL
jgi:hypothetical protein